MAIDKLKDSFSQYFSSTPEFCVRAPGRVNLIGEHTDYNDGYCMPMAIEQAVFMVIAPRSDHQWHVCSLNMDDGVHVIDGGAVEEFKRKEHWTDYVSACLQVWQKDGRELRGADVLLQSTVPVGAGLSSSAAMEMGVLRGLDALLGTTSDPVALARLGQQAENVCIGVQSGILDQLASAMGRGGCASFIDCRALTVESVNLPMDYAVVIADTKKSRDLVSSPYNQRRQDCLDAAEVLGLRALRDANMMQVWSSDVLNEEQRKRAAHVVGENTRVLAAKLMNGADPVVFGELMDQSHADLRDRFEVSCAELDAMVRIARSLPGCVGSRLTGAGFGGCSVHLVKERDLEAFSAELTAQYKAATGLDTEITVSRACSGAEWSLLD